MRPTFALVVDLHRIDGVDGGGGTIVVTCRCGWRSAPSDRAGRACGEWDRHVESGGGGQDRSSQPGVASPSRSPAT